jgi:hypothetical protein
LGLGGPGFNIEVADEQSAEEPSGLQERKPDIAGRWMIFALHRDENGRSIVFTDRDDRPRTFPFSVRDPGQLVASSGFHATVYRFGPEATPYTFIVFSERQVARGEQEKLAQATAELAREITRQDIRLDSL